jgi:hypothetical protein
VKAAMEGAHEQSLKIMADKMQGLYAELGMPAPPPPECGGGWVGGWGGAVSALTSAHAFVLFVIRNPRVSTRAN